jgi:glycerol-3-phosphate dehydrogenase
VKRSPAELTGRTFDLLIVGGGIHGAALLREASLQGWSAALIEHGDFGHATSANSLKIIHGGLRYLQHGDFARTRESVLARRRLLRIAPHLVRPLPCIMPTYRWSKQGRLPLRAAIMLNDFLSRDRNREVREDLHIPRGTLLSAGELLDIAPGIAREGLTGGALWHDCFAESSERLTLGFVVSALEHGARAANYVKAEKYIIEGGAVTGVEARDLIAGTELTINARVVADATGPWLDRLLEDEGQSAAPPPARKWARAANIAVRKSLFHDRALALSRRPSTVGKPSRGQVHFFVPWRDVTLVGTWYWHHRGRDRNPALREEEIMEMVNDVNAVYPAAELRPEDVVFAHIGFLPLEGQGGSETVANLLSGRSRVIDCERERGLAGLIGIEGVKYTTAASTAGKAVLLAAKKLKRPLVTPGEDPPLFGAARGDDAVDRLSPSLPHLSVLYGGCSRKVAEVIGESQEFSRPIQSSGPTVGGEAVYSVRHEMALTLADVVFRRTGLGSAGHPGGEALKECAALVAPELGWDQDRIGREVAVVEEIYRSLLPLNPHPTAKQ